MLKPTIVKAGSRRAELTPERCLVSEIWGDDRVSIAQAIVKPKITTVAHHLSRVDEIYLIAGGKGKIAVEGLEETEVRKGDLIFIPSGSSQKITNIGKSDLVFYCVCTPRFVPECYKSEEDGKS
jgi:mannose-6-phosphate isomerase-like protein (cupin superfamily)